MNRRKLFKFFGAMGALGLLSKLTTDKSKADLIEFKMQDGSILTGTRKLSTDEITFEKLRNIIMNVSFGANIPFQVTLSSYIYEQYKKLPNANHKMFHRAVITVNRDFEYNRIDTLGFLAKNDSVNYLLINGKVKTIITGEAIQIWDIVYHNHRKTLI